MRLEDFAHADEESAELDQLSTAATIHSIEATCPRGQYGDV